MNIIHDVHITFLSVSIVTPTFLLLFLLVFKRESKRHVDGWITIGWRYESRCGRRCEKGQEKGVKNLKRCKQPLKIITVLRCGGPLPKSLCVIFRGLNLIISLKRLSYPEIKIDYPKPWFYAFRRSIILSINL